jgi:hypothetical protein
MIPAPPHETQQSQYRWRGALVSCALNAIGLPLDLLLARNVPNMPRWPALGSATAALLLIIVLLARRDRPTTRLTTTVFLANIGIIIAALWITSGAFAAAPGTWIPFQANKLGALAAAVLAPDLASGLVSIAAFVAMALLRYALLPSDQQQRFPMGEPWTIIIYAVFAVAMLGYRVHSVALARRVLRIRTESIATQRLARTFLALRDVTNTPLQTIELAANVVRARCPDMAPVLDRIDRSLDRLYRLNQAFSMYESRIEWSERDVSPDPSVFVDH